MDPLAQLSDIHLPANVHSYPIAPGWWLLATVVLALIIYGLIKLRQTLLKRKAQKMALKQLSSATDISTIVTVLKWAALQYFPREHVANLTGGAFKTFLMATLPAKRQQKFAELSDKYFISVYQSNAINQQSAEFSLAAKLWLIHALPPQKNSFMLTRPTTSNTSALSSTKAEDKIITEVAKNNGVKS